MATKIQMNILQSNGKYEVLYPETTADQIQGTLTESQLPNISASKITGTLSSSQVPSPSLSASDIPSLSTDKLTSGTLPLARGGTNGTTAATALYNIVSGATARTAANLNSYASSTYIPCYYSTTGYKFALSDIMTYINANVSMSSTVTVSKGGTGLTSLTSGYAVIGNGTGAVTTRAITNNTATTTALTASTNLVTMNTLRYALNRTTGIGSADTSYTTSMMRGIAAGTSAPSSLTSGCVYLVYES